MESLYIEELKSSINLLMANLESLPVSKGSMDSKYSLGMKKKYNHRWVGSAWRGDSEVGCLISNLAFHSNSAISIQHGFVEPFSPWFSPLINIKEISWTSQKCFATPKQKKIFYSFRNLISRFNLFVTLSFIDFQPITINLQFLYIFHRFSFSPFSQKKTWKTKIVAKDFPIILVSFWISFLEIIHLNSHLMDEVFAQISIHSSF